MKLEFDVANCDIESRGLFSARRSTIIHSPSNLVGTSGMVDVIFHISFHKISFSFDISNIFFRFDLVNFTEVIRFTAALLSSIRITLFSFRYSFLDRCLEII